MDNEIAERVYMHRKMMGITQEELANRAGVTRQSVISIESGLASSMRWSTIRKVLEACYVRLRLEWTCMPPRRKQPVVPVSPHSAEDDEALAKAHLLENYGIEI